MERRTFLERVARYRDEGWRLSIVNATSLLPGEGIEGGAFDITWSFAKSHAFEHLRERVLPGEEVPSIGNSFPAAFLYENEMRELFGINVTGINVDLRGQLYKTATKVPFSPSAIRARLEATGRLETGAKHHQAPKIEPQPNPEAASRAGATRP